ncbi:MAG: SAM-dependent methyltransferase [Acidobacteriota bacterium]|nr:SAM-dependent methyltransferase [Acidobacteriota bacterium]
MDWSDLDPVERSAAMTLLWRAAESRREDRLFADPVAEQAAAALPPWPPSAASQVFADLVALRSWQMDAQVETALAAGLDQIVVLGAGVDTRFWRVPPPASATIIELDSDAIHDFARQLLPGDGPGRRLGGRIPGGLARALARAAHDPYRPTLWIAEGLLEYLPGRLWDRLARILTEHSAPESRALITVLGETLPEHFAYDPTFPFPRLPPLARILSAIPEGWEIDVLPATVLRAVPPDAFLILSMRRAEPLPS